MDRKQIIRLAIKYGGEYDKIIKAINEEEKAEDIEVVDNAITIFDENYPKELLELRQPPLVLFYKGNVELLKRDRIGIVGSRTPSEYSCLATHNLAMHTDSVVVSGLAKGTDKFALEVKGGIAVLGCGIDYIYPIENKGLYSLLEREGLILSEYPGLTKPLGFHFPFRNRIISALSKTLYVMECKQTSSTSATINEALELGRQVKVLPFAIDFESEEPFNNKLISEGATPILKEDLL